MIGKIRDLSVISFQIHRSPIPYTPLCLAKAVKNPSEIQGMRMAHVRTSESTTLTDNEMLLISHMMSML